MDWPSRRAPSSSSNVSARQHGQSGPLGTARPQRGSCASSEPARRLWSARHSQNEAYPLSSQPLPRVLERLTCRAVGSTAFGHPGAFVLVTSLGALGFAVVLLPALLLCAGAATLEDDAPATGDAAPAVGGGTELQRPSGPAGEHPSSSSGAPVEASPPVGWLRAARAVGAWNRLAD